jgi:hypothetical protein
MSVDLNFNAVPGQVDLYGLGKSGEYVLYKLHETFLKSEGVCSLGFIQNTRLIWDNKIYYASGVTYSAPAQCKENRRPARPGEKGSRTIPNGGICELFLYDDQLKLLTRQPLKLPDRDGGPWCNGSYALGRVKGMDALLYSVSYYTLNDPPAKRAEDIGTGWYYSTYLFRLVKDDNGHIRFEQDDSCLGSPNPYRTVAQARKALKACAESNTSPVNQ